MFKRTNVRFIIIGVAILLALYSLYWTFAFNSFSDEKREELRSKGIIEKYEDRTIRLGLDLQGGIHIILELNLPKLVESLASNKTPQFYSILETSTKEAKETGGDFFNIFQRHIENENFRLVRHFSNRGYKNDEIISSLKEESKDALVRGLEIIRNRVDQFGVSEPTIQKIGQYRIIVELAGVQDPERARKLIQSTALLEFTLLKDPEVTQSFIASVDNYLKTGEKGITEKPKPAEEDSSIVPLKESKDKAVSISDLLGITEADVGMEESEADTSLVVDEELFAEMPFSSLLRNVRNNIGVPERNVYAVKKILNNAEVKKLLPFDSKILWSAKPERLTMQDGKTENFHLLYTVNREASMQGKYITKAQATIAGSGSQSAGQAIVKLHMNSEGAKLWSRLTGSNVDKNLAIVLDDKVYSAPVIRTKISGGESVIEGMRDTEDAKDLAIVLRAGALPAPVDIIEERTIGPSLGRDSINTGTRAGIIGALLVIIFMVIYYRISGLLADLALILNLIFVMAIMTTLNATLTLPGIAGLILTIGIAVDANVLVFERIREELRKGKTVRAAIDSGYSRAFITILDANVTTIFAALILWQFGSGPVRGFAVTLFWGILSSLFTALFVTRTFYNYVTERRVLKTLSI